MRPNLDRRTSDIMRDMQLAPQIVKTGQLRRPTFREEWRKSPLLSVTDSLELYERKRQLTRTASAPAPVAKQEVSVLKRIGIFLRSLVESCAQAEG